MIVTKKYTFREKFSWSLYDWGNSAYTTTVMAAFFPIFFEKYWSNPDDVIQSTYHLGIAASTASLFEEFGLLALSPACPASPAG